MTQSTRSIPVLVPALALLAAATLPSQLSAQAEQPAVDTSATAAPTGTAQQRRAETASGGTTVLGDRETPIGLYIIPWRSSAPTPQMDRPARLLDETEEPVDPVQFGRFVEYHDALSRHRAAQRAAGN